MFYKKFRYRWHYNVGIKACGGPGSTEFKIACRGLSKRRPGVRAWTQPSCYVGDICIIIVATTLLIPILQPHMKLALNLKRQTLLVCLPAHDS